MTTSDLHPLSASVIKIHFLWPNITFIGALFGGDVSQDSFKVVVKIRKLKIL